MFGFDANIPLESFMGQTINSINKNPPGVTLNFRSGDMIAIFYEHEFKLENNLAENDDIFESRGSLIGSYVCETNIIDIDILSISIKRSDKPKLILFFRDFEKSLERFTFVIDNVDYTV